MLIVWTELWSFRSKVNSPDGISRGVGKNDKCTSGERPKSGRIDFCVKRRDIVWITSTCGVQVGLKFWFKDETDQIGMSSVSGGCIIYF